MMCLCLAFSKLEIQKSSKTVVYDPQPMCCIFSSLKLNGKQTSKARARLERVCVCANYLVNLLTN